VSEVLQDDDGGGARVRELMLQLARGIQRVGVHHGESGTQGAVRGHGILQDIGHHDGDPVALPKAATVLQEGAELRRKDVELAVGHRLAHVHIGIARGMDGQRLLDHLLERGVFVDIDLGPNAWRIRLEPMFFHGDPSL
jgi:hypothetical protein